MRCLLRPLGAALAAAVAAVAVVAVPPSAVAAPDPGDPFGPTPVLLTEAPHQPSKAADAAAARVGDKVVFRAGTPETGQELWVTDGSPAGTHLLADIWPGPDGGFPSGLTAFAGRVFFAAGDGVHGYELWVTDGTPAGTRMFADLVPGADLSAPRDLVVAGGRLFFSAAAPGAGDELYVSDGTVAGTTYIDVLDGQNSSSPRRITAFGSKVVFRGIVGVADGTGVAKPFVSDGTRAGTAPLDALPATVRVDALEFVPLGDRLLFSAYLPGSGVDLWVSRGAPGDAELVKDVNPGGDDNVAQLTRLDDQVVFSGRNQQVGQELWTSDGTAGGTQLLRDINPGTLPSNPTDFQVLGGRAFFAADDAEHSRELWSTDGTTGGTTLVRDVVPLSDGSFPYAIGVVGGRALFAMHTPDAGYEPWVLEPDGRLEQLGDIYPGPDDAEPYPLTTIGDTAVLAAADGAGDRVYAATLEPSTVQARPKRAYSLKKARAKRVVVKVVVAPAVTGGTVAIVRKGRLVGRAEVVNGVAKVRIRKRLKPGRHRLSVVYRGSFWAQASAPDRFRVRVLKARS